MKSCWFFPLVNFSFPEYILSMKWIQVHTATGNTHPLCQHFSDFYDHANHLGILLKCRFWFSRSGWSLSCHISDGLWRDPPAAVREVPKLCTPWTLHRVRMTCLVINAVNIKLYTYVRDQMIFFPLSCLSLCIYISQSSNKMQVHNRSTTSFLSIWLWVDTRQGGKNQWCHS